MEKLSDQDTEVNAGISVSKESTGEHWYIAGFSDSRLECRRIECIYMPFLSEFEI